MLSRTDDYAIREEDLPKICEEYDKLAAEMIKREKEGRGFNFFHFMIDLDRRTVCGTSGFPAAAREPSIWR